MAVTIREASAADATVLAALHSAGFDDHWSAGAMTDLLALPGAFALLAEEDGAPRGFVLARAAADEGEILSIGVHPVARRQGLGRQLIRAAAARAAASGAARLFLEVAVDNAAALGLYTRHGFAEKGRRKAYYARGGHAPVDALIMDVDLPLPA